MTKIDDFGGPVQLAWTPPKSGTALKFLKTLKNLSWNNKMTHSYCEKVDFMQNAEYTRKKWTDLVHFFVCLL